MACGQGPTYNVQGRGLGEIARVVVWVLDPTCCRCVIHSERYIFDESTRGQRELPYIKGEQASTGRLHLLTGCLSQAETYSQAAVDVQILCRSDSPTRKCKCTQNAAKLVRAQEARLVSRQVKIFFPARHVMLSHCNTAFPSSLTSHSGSP